VAESAVFNLFRVGSKAVTAAATMGNIPGAFVAGGEEGFTQSEELARQGVDLKTRTKVGAVTAVTNAVGFALPAAGKTWAQTGALAVVGGPASFVAQNAATREILQNADYTKLADQYDPFDPVGLALSTVIPWGVGALAMRGAKVKGAAPDAPPKVAPTDDVVDAARVTLVRQHMDAANPVPGDIANADAHVKAYTTAMDQMAAGERVQVDLPADAALQASIAMDQKLRESGATANDVPDLATFAADNGMAIDAPVQAAADPKGNAFISWLKSVGGVSYSQKLDIVGERGVRGNYAGIFTKNGQNLDTLVESAVQAGYLTRAEVDSANDVGGTRALAELIRRATTGEKIKTAEQVDAARISDMQTRANMDAVDAMERELRTLGVDPSAAKGNPEILGAYLADHRTALVNRKLSELDAETKAERIAIGEAYDLTPKQVDDTARIALAQELDEAAWFDAAKYAADDVDFLNRIEEIIRNAPGSRKNGQGGAGVAQDGSIPARNAEATAKHAADATGFNPTAATAEAGSPVTGAAAADPLQKALDGIEGRNPTALDAEIPIDFDADGKPATRMTMRDYLDMVKREAEQDAADANLIEVAATCFLRGGI